MICFQDGNAMSIIRGTQVIATNAPGHPYIDTTGEW
jgi:hypothetical protein